MLNKKITLLLILVAVVLVALIFYFKTTAQPVDDASNMKIFSSQCANEGEVIGSCVGCMIKCCNGLTALPFLKYNGQCLKNPAPGMGATCTYCGNGVCDTQYDEDECNCPKDCK